MFSFTKKFLPRKQSKIVDNIEQLIVKINFKLKVFFSFLKKEKFIDLLLIILAIILLSSFILYLVEPNLTLFDCFWWTIVTMSTIGSSDITLTTTIGRVIGIFDMMMAIGIIAILSGHIASILVNLRIREHLGMNAYHFQDHIIICEWNQQAKVIIKELRHEQKTKEQPIVLIAEIDRKPISDPHLFFVRGEISDETLTKANLAKAKTVIILGDSKLDYQNRDAKVILNTLTVESIEHQAYIIVELVDETYVETCKRAYADEIIVSSSLGSKIISNAAINHGMSNVVTDILSYEYGSQLYKVPIPESEIGCSFIELFIYMKQVYNSTIIAVQKGSEGQIISNPPNNYLMESHDHLILISSCRNSISTLQKKLFSRNK